MLLCIILGVKVRMKFNSCMNFSRKSVQQIVKGKAGLLFT